MNSDWLLQRLEPTVISSERKNHGNLKQHASGEVKRRGEILGVLGLEKGRTL